MTDNTPFLCSTLAKDEPLIGTASRNAFHFVLSIPKREWLPVVETMSGAAGTLANLIKPLKDQAMLSLKNGSADEKGTVWLFPHGYRFDNLAPDDYPMLLDQALNGHITLPHEKISDQTYILVCTHSKRDACCGKHGTAFFTALKNQAPAEMTIWEVSHLGGHRFAATLVVQPAAQWYGKLKPEDIPTFLQHLEQGRVWVEHYRGNAAFPPPLQVAEAWGWEQGSSTKINLVNPQVNGSTTQVEVSVNGERTALTLHSETLDFVADCSGARKDRLVWRVTTAERIEVGSTA